MVTSALSVSQASHYNAFIIYNVARTLMANTNPTDLNVPLDI